MSLVATHHTMRGHLGALKDQRPRFLAFHSFDKADIGSMPSTGQVLLSEHIAKTLSSTKAA